MCLWYDTENVEENVADNIGIRCNNSGKTAGLSVKIKIKSAEISSWTVAPRTGDRGGGKKRV